MTLRSVALAALSALMVVACYDSRWGSTKRAQTHNLTYSMPATLSADTRDHPPATKGYRVHAFVTPGYVAENLEYAREIRALVDAANAVVGPALGVRLELGALDEWRPGAESDLQVLLDALHGKDDEADWVIGFVGATPIATDSFHDVGRADTPGRYLALRAASRLSDHVAAERAFDELPQEERSRVVRARKEHRALAVLLHELGHTLGAVHETDATSVMRPAYDKDTTGFTAEGLGLMRLTLAHRSEPATRESDAAFAKQMLAQLDGATKGAWVEADRLEMIERLRAFDAAPPAPAATRPPGDAPPPMVYDLPELGPSDRTAWARAKQLDQGGDVEGAWKTAAPLFKLYPDVYAVQDLRCQLATKRVGWPKAEPECATVVKLTRGPAPKK